MKVLYPLQPYIPTSSIASGPYADKVATRIHIMGARRSLNQSLAMMLEMAFGASCTYDDGPPHFDALDLHSEGPSLLLIDCLCLTLHNFEDQLASRSNKLLRKWEIVLFNVDVNNACYKNIDLSLVQGIFSRDDTKEIFLQGVQAILDGRKWISRTSGKSISKVVPKDMEKSSASASHELSDRESEILRCVASGMSNTRIASELTISPHTAKTHVYNIFRKIGISNRLQARLWVVANL